MPESRQPVVQQAKRPESLLSRIWVLPPVLGHAIGGSFIGAVAGYMFIPQLISFENFQALWALFGLNFEPADWFWFPAALGGAAGAIGGITYGTIAGAREVRRNAGFRQTAGSLGGEFSPSSDPELSGKLRRFFPGSYAPEVHNVIRTQMQGIRITVGDVTLVQEMGTGTDSSTRSVSQTAAYYESDALRFPKFTLQPEGFLLNLLSSRMGIEDIDFPARPEFSRAYHLSAVHAENTRRLFNNDRLLEGLGRRQGLYVASDSGSLVIYRPGKLCEAGELRGFVSEAAEIFRLFEDSARRSGLTADAVPAEKVNVHALAAKMPGLIGKIIRETLVTRADVDAFIHQPPPRMIPANILRYCDRDAPILVIVVGIAFALAGALIAFAVGYDALSTGRGLMSVKWEGAILGLVFLAGGGSIAVFFARIRFRMKRLLRHGQLSAAKIEKIVPTGWQSGGEEISRMMVQHQAEGRLVQASCKITGGAALRAQKLAVDKKPAAILYDPANPQRILFVESLLNVSPEYEQ